MNFRSRQIFLSHNGCTGIDNRRHRFSLHYGNQRLYSFTARLLGILGDERLNLTSFQAFHESGRRVEADELLAAREVILLEREQYAESARFVCAENSVRLFELVQHGQRGRLCFADGRAGVAIVENNLNVGKFLDCFEEARLSLTRASATFLYSERALPCLCRLKASPTARQPFLQRGGCWSIPCRQRSP